MKVIQPNCRIQFTARDAEFVLSSLSSNQGTSEAIEKLTAHPESFDTVLDDEQLFRRLLEHNGYLNVSPQFYFYMLVRHSLRRAGIENRNVADYVASMLAEFSVTQRTRCPIPGDNRPMEYIFEMLTALQTADEPVQFLIRAHVGNHSLFLAGVFADHIQHRAQFRGAPEMQYYESLGSSNYKAAGDHPMARKYELAPIFTFLAEEFHTIRVALNDLSERLVTLNDRVPGLDTIVKE